MMNTTLKYTLQAAIIFCCLNSNQIFAGTNSATASVLRFQTKMAERGAAESQYNLGFIHETGSGVEENLDQAKHWYKKASAQGFKPASNRLMYLQIKSSGISNEHIYWLRSLKKSAESNNKDALFLLGQMYAEGTGVHKSLTLSLELLRKAARKNITSAEAHITRIERELAALQLKYALPDAHKNTHKPAANVNKMSTHKTDTPNTIKSIKKSPSTIKPQSKYQHKPLSKATVAAKTKTKKAPSVEQKTAVMQGKTNTNQTTQITSSSPSAEFEYSHPMDMICGGSNRFMSGCR